MASTKDQEGRRNRARDERARSKRERASGDADERVDSEKERVDPSIRGRLESMVPEVFKRAMISGLGAIFMTEETIRSVVSDMPKDAVNFLVQQAENTKEQLANLIAKEVREFLEGSDLSDELAKLLTKLSLEVRTQVRFVPNDEALEPVGVKPEMKHEFSIKHD